MCGRYRLDDKAYNEVLKLIRKLDQNAERPNFNKDIFPGTFAPVISSNNQDLDLTEKLWGYPHFKNKGLIINAKSETVLEKPTFYKGIRQNRIIIPASYFYEWNANNEKANLYRKDGKTLYMAGFFDSFQGQDRFVILTTKANPSMEKIHPRMPLILEENMVQDWILKENSLEKLLGLEPKALDPHFEIQQVTMF